MNNPNSFSTINCVKVDHFCEITKNLSTRFIPRYFDKDAFDAVESMLDYLVCHAAYPRFVMNISMLDMYYEKVN